MNGVDVVVDIAKESLYTVISVALPVLLVSLIVGLIVSIFQTVTSIQEQTLTFVPKIVAVFITLVVVGSWMLETLVDFAVKLWSDFDYYLQWI